MALWMQTLDELERNILRFRPRQLARTTKYGRQAKEHERSQRGVREMSAIIVLSLVGPLLLIICSACIADTYSKG
jgi:hypothetical protein